MPQIPRARPAEHDNDLYDTAPCGYLSTAADGIVLRLNATLLAWLGMQASDVIGRRRFQDLLAAGPRVMWETHHLALLESAGHVNGVSLQLVRSDGIRLPVLASATLGAPGHDGRPGLRLTLFDARERMAYETSLVAARVAAEDSEHRARVLQRVTLACAAAASQDVLLDEALRACVDEFRCSGAALWIAEDNALTRAAALDVDDDLAPRRLRRDGRTPFGRSWRSRELVVLESPELLEQGYPRSSGRFAAAGVEALLAVPVTDGEETLGVLGLLLPSSRPVGELEREVYRTVGALIGAALVRGRMHAELRRLALHDALTGLANRVLLADRLDQALSRARRSRGTLGVLMVDLDGFKEVNDSLGHDAGDRLLRACADRLTAAVRPGDTVARLGGDEFAVLCEDIGTEVITQIAERVRTALAVPVDVAGTSTAVTASVGVAVSDASTAPANAAETLLAQADAAMYSAKRAGKNQHQQLAPSVSGRVRKAQALREQVERAVSGDGLELHYQPVFDLRSGAVVGVEALSRLRELSGALIMPGSFLPIVEQEGWLVPFGGTVLQAACTQLAQWLRQGLPAVQLAVNVHAEQAARPGFAHDVLRTVGLTGCPADQLVLEITESALLEAAPGTLDELSLLREAGVGISLDDFGTQYASLHYLSQFPLTELKVDRSFVQELPERRVDNAIVRALARLAADLDLTCVVEGIETQAQLSFLRDLDVRGQGYLLARPLPAADVVEHLRRPPLWS